MSGSEPSTTQSPGQSPAEQTPVPGERPVLGARSDFTIADERTVTLPAGTTLHRSPSSLSPTLLTLEMDRQLPLAERRGGWVLVRLDDLRVWARSGDVELDDSGLAEELPPELAALVAPSPQRVARAARLLGEPPERWLGPYRLLTDLEEVRQRDAALLERLERLAGAVETAYVKRYALEIPRPPEPRVIVIFRRDKTYRAFVAEEGAIAGSSNIGHASPGMMVLALGSLDDEELAATFVHEQVHLLNQLSLVRELSPWLEEGLAEDLALSRVTAAGELDVATLRGTTILRSGREWDERGEEILVQELVVRGPRVALGRVVERWSERGGPDLVALLDLPWREFALGDDWDRNYVESAFLLRYLLDAQSEAFGEGLRRFLRAVRRGAESDAASLAEHLGVAVEEIEEGFAAWVSFQAVESPQ